MREGGGLGLTWSWVSQLSFFADSAWDKPSEYSGCKWDRESVIRTCWLWTHIAPWQTWPICSRGMSLGGQLAVSNQLCMYSQLFLKYACLFVEGQNHWKITILVALRGHCLLTLLLCYLFYCEPVSVLTVRSSLPPCVQINDNYSRFYQNMPVFCHISICHKSRT